MKSSFVIRYSSFAAWLLALSSWLLALPGFAATREYDAEAAAVVQIDSVTFGGTWVAAEAVSVKIGNATLTVTTGSDTVATATLATAVKNAINAPTIDGSLVGAEQRNAAGQLLGEFRDVEAIIDPANTSRVLVRSRVAGVPFYDVADVAAPFTLAVSETSAAGTAVAASVQVATGPWHWDNQTNWSSNMLPINDDLVVFRNTAHGPKFGMPNLVLEVTVEQHANFTGTIGLPPVNLLGYSEYRQRYARFDDAGTGTNIAHRFGLGAGPGSPLINIRHATVKCSPIVYATGVPAKDTKALNIVCTANTSTLNILGGSIDYSSQDSVTSAFLTVLQSGGDTRGVNGHAAGASFGFSGGTATIGGSVAVGAITTYGGVLRIENQTATISTLKCYGGMVYYPSTATISALSMDKGTFDTAANMGGLTVTAAEIYQGSKLLDPFRRIIFTAPINLHYDPSPELQFGARAGSPITIDN